MVFLVTGVSIARAKGLGETCGGVFKIRGLDTPG